jgi:5'-nucleotidase
MAIDFTETLVIGISSRALFDLEDANSIFVEKGVLEYKKYQREREDVLLKPGSGFHVVKALLDLNKLSQTNRLVEVIVMSRNSPETAARVLKSIDKYELDITRSAFTGGKPLCKYMEAFNVDLFLSKDEGDVQNVIDSKAVAAALIYDPPPGFVSDYTEVRIAFDADAVIFSEESEVIYKTKGLEEFHSNEKANIKIPLAEGPYAKLLKMLSRIQEKMHTGVDRSPLRIAIVTARNSPSHMRVINTLREWNVYVDEAFFLGGVSKDKILEAFQAHIFFDDQELHLAPASKLVPTARVPYCSDSPMRKLPNRESLTILKG